MAGKFEIIARYTEGTPKYWIGRKKDLQGSLDEDNVEWKCQDGVPVIFRQYSDASMYLSGK